MSERFQSLAALYLQTNFRIETKLNMLSHQLQSVCSPAESVIKVLRSPVTPLPIFKVLILLHYCYLARSLQSEHIMQILKTLKVKKSKTALQKIVSENVNEHYQLYLLRRLQADQDQDLEDGQKMYRNMNLLHRISSFSEILYTFGRYFQKKYQFVLDFNILIAKDLSCLYNQLKSILRRKPDPNFGTELQALHQKMYVVYYNCYYHRYVQKYAPKWINTNLFSSEQLSKSSSSIKVQSARKSTLRRANSVRCECPSPTRQEGLSYSCGGSNSVKGIEMDNLTMSRFQVLKSMERVLEMQDS